MAKPEVTFIRRFDWRAGYKTVVHDTQSWRTLIKQKNDIQTRLREFPLNKPEKLGEMLEELNHEN